MKKRLLSLLLLVAMIVTALPLVVLPTFATDAAMSTWTEADYDELYAARDAAILSLDFFRANAYWNETVELPAKPETLTAWEWNGDEWDFTDPANRIIPEGKEYYIKGSSGNYYPGKDGAALQDRYSIYAAYTESEANALVAELGAGWSVLPYANWYVKQVKSGTTKWLGTDGTLANGVAAVFVKADAINKAEELAGTGATENGDGSFTATDGAVYSIVWRPQINFAYKQACNDYAAKIVALLKDCDTGTPTVGFALNLPTMGTASYQDYYGDHMYAPFTVGAGYMELDPHFANSYFQLNNIPATGTLFLDAVVAGGLTNVTNHKILALRGLNLLFTVNANGTSFAGTNGAAAAALTAHTVEGRETPFRLTIDSTVDAATTTMTFKTTVDGVQVYGDEDDAALSAASAASAGLFAHANSSRFRFYTLRMYNRSLTAAEQAQNHFADLAKWFRIDLTPLGLLTAADMAPVYAAVADFGFDSDKEAVEAAVLAAATEAAQEKYTDFPESYVALAVEYGLDLSPLTVWPKGMLSRTYAFLDGGYTSSSNVAADYKAALEQDIGSKMTAEEYNALYVQEGLAFAADFATSNEYWNYAGANGGMHTAATAKTLLNSYQWAGSRGFAAIEFRVGGPNSTVLSETNVAIADGYLDLKPFYGLQPYNFHLDIASGHNGATAEIVRNFTSNGAVVHFLGVRMDANVTTGKSGTLIGNSNTSADGKVCDVDITFNSLTKVSTHTVTALRPEMSNGSVSFTVGAGKKPVYTELSEDVPIDSTDAAVSVIDLDNVVFEAENYAARTRPFKEITPAYVKQGGVYTENTAGTKYYVEMLPRFVKGELAIYQDGNLLYENDSIDYINNTFHDNDTHTVLWGQSASAATTGAKLYFMRYYGKQLTPAEQAQNHFADVAKFFRLNLVGFESLSDSDKAALYAAVADINVETSTQGEAQAAVSSILNAKADAAYEAMKDGVTDPDLLAFIDKAKSWRLDITEVLATKRNMTSVYTTDFEGLSCEAAQAKLDEAYLDAYYYLSYNRFGEDEWNDMLIWCATHPYMTGADRVDLEPLMALPFEERVGILDLKAQYESAPSVAAAQAIIDGYVAEAAAKYEREYADFDYDSLYQQEGLIFKTDFFKTNRYWNTEGVTYAPPVGPAENDNYFYDANGNGEEDEGERYDLTDLSVRNAWRLLITYNGAVTGYYEPTNPEGSFKGVEYSVVRLQFAMQAEAEAAIAGAMTDIAASIAAKSSTVDITKLSLSAVEVGSNAFYDAYIKWKNTEDRTYLASFSSVQKAGIGIFSYIPAIGAARTDYATNSGKCHAVYTFGDGYIQMREDFHSSGGLQITGMAAAHGTDNISMQMVSSYKAAPGSEFVLWYNIRPLVAGSGSFQFTGVKTGFAATFASTPSIPTGYENVSDLTFTLKGGKTAGGTDDYFAIRTPGATLAEATGTYNGALNDTNYFDYNHKAKGMRIYAIRWYNEELSDEAILANHFADVAKFYRLDLSVLAQLSDVARNAVISAFADVSIDGDLTRDAVQNIVDAAAAETYAGLRLVEDEEKNERFLLVAAKATLDLAPIENLRATDRETLIDTMLSKVDPYYAFDKNVALYYYESLTYDLSLLTFEGYQVRLDSGSVLANYAGVRAVYKVDLDRIEEICKTGKEVGASVSVTVDGNEAAVLTFFFAWDSENEALIIEGTNTVGDNDPIAADIVVEEQNGKTVGTFYYTVTFKGDSFTVDNLQKEFGYAYAIGYGDDIKGGVYDKGYTFGVSTQNFGDTVSAIEVYDYFFAHGYHEDPVVQSVCDLPNG